MEKETEKKEETEKDLDVIVQELGKKVEKYEQLNMDLVRTLQTLAQTIVDNVGTIVEQKISEAMEKGKEEKNATQTPPFSINDLAQ